MLVFLGVGPFLLSSLEGLILFISIFLLYFFSCLSVSGQQALVSWCNEYMSDTLGMYMVYITVLVLGLSLFFLPSMGVSSNWGYLSLGVMLQFCVWMFSASDLLSMYFFYEASLVPIIFIIIKWGSYPERSLSAFMLLIYTLVFTLPFVYVLFYIFFCYGSFNFAALNFIASSYVYSSVLIPLVVFLTFAVKLPIYGLHFWLPIAHVEAPTFGSMLLAGVLLNLGGVGMIRLPYFVSQNVLLNALSGYLLVGLAFVTLVCCFQSDFNRLVAYSSVSHMMALPPLLVLDSISSNQAALYLMLFHGLSSPMLFILVSVFYTFYSTRQLIAMRGLLLVSPFLVFVSILCFLFTISAPPFPSFLGEVLFVVSVSSLSWLFMVSIFLFAFFSMVYSLMWLASVSFNSAYSSISTNYSSSYSVNFAFVGGLIVTAFFLVVLGVMV